MEFQNSVASSGITNNSTLIFNNAAAQDYTKSISGSGTLTKTGAGTLTLSDVKSYAGKTTVSQGTLSITNAGLSSTSALDVASAATFTTTVNNTFGGAPTGAWTIAGTITSNGSGIAQSMPASVTLNGGTMSGNGIDSPGFGNFLNGQNTTLTANGTGNSISGRIGMFTGLTLSTPSSGDVLSVSGTLGATFNAAANSGGLTKSGAGTVALSGTSTYTGATAVNGGTLDIASGGSTAAGSAVTVSNSGSALVVNGTVNGSLNANVSTTVSGTGTIAGAATVSGNLNPGTSPGVLSFGSSLGLAGTTVTTMEIASGGMTRGTDYDGINVGSLTYAGALDLALGTTFGAGNYTFNLFDLFTSESGSFDSVDLTGSYTGSLTNNLGVWSTTTNGGNETWTFTQASGDLNLAVIPEPSTILLGALGMLVLLRRRR